MENIKVVNRRGLALSVVVHAPKEKKNRPLVILLHGFTGDKKGPHITTLAQALASNGFFAVRFDCSGSGESEGTFEKDYHVQNYLDDIEDVFDYAKNIVGVNKDMLGVWGHSMGGQLACIFAATHQEVKSLCAVSPPSMLGNSYFMQKVIPQAEKVGYYEKESATIGKIRVPAEFFADRMKYDLLLHYKDKITLPKLFIWGTEDKTVQAEETETVFLALSEPKEKLVVEGMGHDYKKYPVFLDKVNAEVINFFKKTLVQEVKPSLAASEPVASQKKPEKIALVYSTQDPAGELIAQKIAEIGKPEWAEIYSFDEDIVFVDLKKVKEDKVVFLSRHKSEFGTKSLTVHMIGNFSEAKFGGKSRELSNTLARIGANYLRALNEKNISSGLSKQGFVTSLEVTHHGPFTKKKCVFIELGSSPLEWKNELAAKLIAEVVIEATMKENKDKVVIGLGGGHYAPDFTKLCLRAPFAFGHICPKHQLENLNRALLRQMIERSGATQIILDWKGLKENKEKVVELCKRASLPVERVQTILK